MIIQKKTVNNEAIKQAVNKTTEENAKKNKSNFQTFDEFKEQLASGKPFEL